MKPIFLIITSETCGHCTKFKNDYLSAVKEALKNIVDIVELNASDRSSVENFHLKNNRRDTLFKGARGVPYFCLISREIWDNPNTDLSVEEFPAEKFQPDYPYKAEYFKQWIVGKGNIVRIENNLKTPENKKSVKSSRGPNFVLCSKNS